MAPNLTADQIRAIRTAHELNNMSAGHHNKCKTLVADIPKYSPEALDEVLPKLMALLFAVDDWQQKANAQLTAALNDKDYPQ